MSEQTVNYHFIKPQPEDFVDVQDLNDNFDSIDAILKEQEDALEGLTPEDIGAAPTDHNHSADDITSGTLPVARGGTGGGTAAAARSSLGAQAQIRLGTITLSGTGWTSHTTYWTKTCTVSGATVTANSKVDLQEKDTVITQMKTDGCKKLYVVNDNGVLTAYAVGAALSVGVTVQCTVMEVATV